MTYKPMSLRDVAMLLDIKPYQISYALSAGLVPEPAMRLLNKRVFFAEDVERLAQHFKHTSSKHQTKKSNPASDERSSYVLRRKNG